MMFYKWKRLYVEIAAVEREEGFQYDVVYHTRADRFAWIPLPSFRVLFEDGMRGMTYVDHAALLPRSLAGSALRALDFLANRVRAVFFVELFRIQYGPGAKINREQMMSFFVQLLDGKLQDPFIDTLASHTRITAGGLPLMAGCNINLPSVMYNLCQLVCVYAATWRNYNMTATRQVVQVVETGELVPSGAWREWLAKDEESDFSFPALDVPAFLDNSPAHVRERKGCPSQRCKEKPCCRDPVTSKCHQSVNFVPETFCGPTVVACELEPADLPRHIHIDFARLRRICALLSCTSAACAEGPLRIDRMEPSPTAATKI
jgi:hypothetical protein